MPRKRDTTIQESLEELQKLEKRHRGTPEAARITMLRLLKEDPKRGMEEAALLVGASVPTVKRWWRAYREGGVEGMLKPAGRIKPEPREDQLELVKRKLSSGEFKTLDELEGWIAAYKTEVNRSRNGKNHRHLASSGRAIEALRSASDYSPVTVDEVFRFLAALPTTHNLKEWADTFRTALQSLLSDVDRVSVSLNLQCDLINPEEYQPGVYVSQHIATGRNSVNTVAQQRGESGDEHRDRYIENLRRINFPFNEYQEPHSFVYYYRQQAYLGTLLLWRLRNRPPLSRDTLEIMERMQNFIELLLSDFVARHQVAKPVEHAFDAALDELTRRSGLTLQERRILILQLLGFTYEEVADTLNISLNTVRYHLRSIYAKTETHSQAELFAKYFTPRIDPQQAQK